MAIIGKLVTEMEPGQKFQFTKTALTGENFGIVWQKCGTRSIARIHIETGEKLNQYYYAKTDFGYYIQD